MDFLSFIQGDMGRFGLQRTSRSDLSFEALYLEIILFRVDLIPRLAAPWLLERGAANFRPTFTLHQSRSSQTMKFPSIYMINDYKQNPIRKIHPTRSDLI
jgi:hypothetical protein